jgi:HNH endonuclease/NUMOD4 motif
MKNELEIWKNIDGYSSYQVSSKGNIFSKFTNKCLKTGLNGAGYLQVTLYHHENPRKYFMVHRLVGKAFLQNTENKPQINHINGIKTDNRIKNLEWNTRSENMSHAFKTELQNIRGENHPRTKLVNTDILTIRKLLKEGIAQKEIANLFNVSIRTISYIKCEGWSHVTEN